MFATCNSLFVASILNSYGWVLMLVPLERSSNYFKSSNSLRLIILFEGKTRINFILSTKLEPSTTDFNTECFTTVFLIYVSLFRHSLLIKSLALRRRLITWIGQGRSPKCRIQPIRPIQPKFLSTHNLVNKWIGQLVT